MLHRPPSPGALRSRERRKRQKAGIDRDYKIRVNTRRLLRALRLAEPSLPGGELTTEQIEIELNQIIERFCTGWLGPLRK
jgi:hypothetical protein